MNNLGMGMTVNTIDDGRRVQLILSTVEQGTVFEMNMSREDAMALTELLLGGLGIPLVFRGQP